MHVIFNFFLYKLMYLKKLENMYGLKKYWWTFVFRNCAVSLLAFLVSACVLGKTDIYEGYNLSGSLKNYDTAELIQRHLDMINALRIERGLSGLRLSRNLSAAALTHARDISFQKRAWNFGSDYSSPQERALIAGYTGRVRGENVSETFKGEFDIINIWLKQPLAKSVIFDPIAKTLGFGWFQEENGRTWWVQLIGD